MVLWSELTLRVSNQTPQRLRALDLANTFTRTSITALPGTTTYDHSLLRACALVHSYSTIPYSLLRACMLTIPSYRHSLLDPTLDYLSTCALQDTEWTALEAKTMSLFVWYVTFWSNYERFLLLIAP